MKGDTMTSKTVLPPPVPVYVLNKLARPSVDCTVHEADRLVAGLIREHKAMMRPEADRLIDEITGIDYV